MIVNDYSWRTYHQQEIDWVEERGGKLYGYKIKWNANKKVKAPSSWLAAYPDAEFHVVTPDNYLDWIANK